MNEEIRSLFPALSNFVYLNNAAVSPIPIPSVEAIISQLRDVSENGALNYTNWVATKERTRKLVAEMLSVSPEEIAFMRNTSDGFSAVAMGLQWKEDDNIVTFEGEFPSNFYPWKMVSDRFGVELRICPKRNALIDIEELIRLVDKNTKVIALSAVQFDTGFKVDLERIGGVARKYDALFAVDIIQAFGAVELNLKEQFVDIAAGSSHKWLCAPEGCGILYISQRVRDRISPPFVGWISVIDPWDFDNKLQGWKPNALALESGTSCSSLFYGLEKSLEIIKSIGIKNIEIYLEKLTDQLCERLSSKGYKVASSRKNGEKSQIVAIIPKSGYDHIRITKDLERQGIIVSARNGFVRVAPHFFNNESDIESLIEHLP